MTKPKDKYRVLFYRLMNPKHYEGRFDGTHKRSDPSKNYNEVFEDLVTKLTRVLNYDGTPPNAKQRLRMVEVITEAYIEQTGERPQGIQLFRLANFLLLDELTDSHPDKVTRTEYPIMNKRQLKLRHGRELANENDSLNYAKVRKEISKKTNRGYNFNEI